MRRHLDSTIARTPCQSGLDLVATGKVRIDVTEVLPLSDAKIVLDRLASGTSRGKLILATN